MAKIDTYLNQIRTAVYGEEVRGSIINALEAQNNETESNTSNVDQALVDAAQAVNTANAAAETALAAAQTVDDAAAEAVQIAQDAADRAESTANAAADNANTAATAANNAAMTQIASYDISYQASSIGTEPPTGEWIHSIPTVAEGNYLWTRVVITDISGNGTTFYSVSKMGSSSGGGGTGGGVYYGICESSGDEGTKTVVCDGFTLDTGATINIKFIYTNTATSASMNINGTGAYPIYYKGSRIAANELKESSTYFFVFDGAYYTVVGELSSAAIDELKQDIAQINEDLSELTHYYKINSLEELGDLVNILANNQPAVIWLSTDACLEITGSSSYGVGIAIRNTTNIDFLFSSNTGSRFYTGRYATSTKTISTLTRYAVQSSLDEINTSLSELQKDTVDITDEEIEALFAG